MKKVILITGFTILVHHLSAQFAGTGPVTTNDKIGIGTENPTEMVTISDASEDHLGLTQSAGNSWQFRVGTSGSLIFRDDYTEKLRIDANSNLGFGTTNPLYKLDIKSDVNGETAVRVNNQTAGTSASAGFKINSQGNNIRLISFADTHSSNPNENWLVSQAGGSHIVFGTQDTERMRIQANGNIGIGTTSSPNEKVSIEDASKAQIELIQSLGRAWQFRVGTSGSLIFRDDNVEKLRIDENGNVGIGVTNPDSKLVVDGKIRCEEVKVEIINGPDYVFESDYELRTLEETKEYITDNKHLPEIPSAKEMEANGVDLGDMNMRLLKKIEELTLHQIQLMEQLKKTEC